jgi:hypothetical protein
MKHYVVLLAKVMFNLLLGAGLDYAVGCGLILGFTFSHIITDMFLIAESNRRVDVYQEEILSLYSGLINPPTDIRRR